MPRVVVPLIDTKIRNAKSKDKDYTLPDGKGLHLLVKKNGSKLWEFVYKSPITLKRRKTSFGTYPQVNLITARTKRNDCLNQIANNIDPIEEKREIKKKRITNQIKVENTFYKVSQEWWENYKIGVSENYHYKIGRILESHVYPSIGNNPINEVTRLDLIDILKNLKDQGKYETANRTFMIINKVFMYATMLEITPHNITADIDKKIILGKKIVKHYPTFTDNKDIKGLLLSIDEYSGDFSTRMALKTLPYLFVRSFNIRHCEWSEINFEDKQWIIPADKMKTNKDFILPLPHQVISILKEVKKVNSDSQYVFKSSIGEDKPLSDNTLISALRRMGYSKKEIVPHSFRSIFSTIAYENMQIHGYAGEIIEALLAHQEHNKIKQAYNRAQYKEPMKNLIQWYADYLDKIKNLN